MIYLVSKEHSLFKSDKYHELSPEDAIKMLKQEKILGADTETEGLCPVSKKILSIQLGNEEFQIVWDCISYPLIMLKEVLEDPNILFIWHNYSFDSQWLLQAGIVQPNYFDTMIGERVLNNGKDRSSYSISLKACALKYCNYDMDKTARGEIITKGLTERTIVYSATDVKYSIPIYKAQQEELIKYHVRKAAQFESKFTIITGYFKLCGVKLDINKWKAKMQSDKEEETKYKNLLNDWVVNYYKEHNGNKGYIEYITIVDTQFIHRGDNNIPKDLASLNIDVESKYHLNPSSGTFKQVDDDKYGFIVYGTYKIPFGYTDKKGFHSYVIIDTQGDLFTGFNLEPQCTINWSSSKQLIPLFELLGFSLDTYDKETKTYKKSVGEPIISPQRDVSPIADIYLKYKEASTVCDSFGEKFLKAVSSDGRIHGDWNSIGTDTFRMSCKGYVRGVKINMQQLPSDAVTRACFVSEPGNKFISIDMSGQESRIMASLANDKQMIDLLRHGDIHSFVAKASFSEIPREEPIENIKKDYHTQRQHAKKVEFSIAYGGDAHTIMQRINCSEDKAKEIYDAYMNTFPLVRDYQTYCKQKLLEDGYILMDNFTGAKCFLPEWSFIKDIRERMKDSAFWQMFKEDSTLKAEYRHYKTLLSDYGRQAINYRIQRRGSGCFKLACMLFFKYIVNKGLLNKVKFLIGAHDELNFEAPNDIADKLARVYQQCVIKGSKPFCPNIEMASDISFIKDTTELPTYWIH